MEYKCPKCGEIFNEEDICVETDYEYYEFWGATGSYKVEYWYCPHCHEEISDANEYREEDEEEEEE